MIQFEKPDSPEEWLARITVALLITALVAGVIVGAVMWLLLDAPAWSLAVATVFIFTLMLVLAFSPEDESTDEENENGISRRWGQAGKAVGTFWLLGVLSNPIYYELHAPLWLMFIYLALSIVFSLAFGFSSYFNKSEPAEPTRLEGSNSSEESAARETSA